MPLPELADAHWPKFRAALPRQDGKVFVITGTTSGTGKTAARAAAELGGTVVMLNRKSERSVAVLEELQAAVPEGKFVAIECDLQDLASVRAAAEAVRSQFDAIDVLASNAGIMAEKDKATKDGFDVQMQTNHLSHFLLTKELYPLVEAAAEKNGEARLVQHSSLARQGPRLREKYFQKNGGKLGGNSIRQKFARYQQTKLANIVFAFALADKLAAKNSKVKSLVCHPGSSFTSLADTVMDSYSSCIDSMFAFFARMVSQSGNDGAMGLVKCMCANDVSNGDFYGPNGLNKMAGRAVLIPHKKKEDDKSEKELLWRVSEEVLGEKFEL